MKFIILIFAALALTTSCNKAQKVGTNYSVEAVSSTGIESFTYSSYDGNDVLDLNGDTYFLKEWKGKNINKISVSIWAEEGTLRIFKDNKLVAEQSGTGTIQLQYETN